jgi:DNA polymerase-1
MRRLLLIDGMNLVRRIYEAQPTPDSPEKAQGALRSSLASFRRALREHEPTHVLAAFDHGGPTWRHALLASYHENRKSMPEPLRDIMPRLLDEVRALGIPVLSIPNVEADDVIATAALHWLKSDRGAVTILSTDKDLTALIANGASVWDHFSRDWRDEAWIHKKFGVSAAQLQDYLALSGDSSDNVPGVPGVGPKTAAKWLNQYGSLDQLLAQVESVPGKIGETLRANLDKLQLARQLVEFKTDIQLGLTWNALRFKTAKAA